MKLQTINRRGFLATALSVPASVAFSAQLRHKSEQFVDVYVGNSRFPEFSIRATGGALTKADTDAASHFISRRRQHSTEGFDIYRLNERLSYCHFSQVEFLLAGELGNLTGVRLPSNLTGLNLDAWKADNGLRASWSGSSYSEVRAALIQFDAKATEGLLAGNTVKVTA
jgi:hypothetical protein